MCVCIYIYIYNSRKLGAQEKFIRIGVILEWRPGGQMQEPSEGEGEGEREGEGEGSFCDMGQQVLLQMHGAGQEW